MWNQDFNAEADVEGMPDLGNLLDGWWGHGSCHRPVGPTFVGSSFSGNRKIASFSLQFSVLGLLP